MGGCLRMPSPQAPSFHPATSVETDWAQLAATLPEFMRVRKSLCGVPHDWLEWVEKRTARRTARGVAIHKPLQYRMACLLSGVVLLQEGKFLADLVENSLRFAFVQHTTMHDCALDLWLHSVPGSKQLQSRIGDSGSINSAVLEFDFYQITETMARNWKWIGDGANRKPGFRFLFWKQPCCRDVNAFRRDTTAVRKLRNTIAHSKQLLTRDHVAMLFRISSRWLDPLQVNVLQRIRDYRERRPLFLSDLAEV